MCVSGEMGWGAERMVSDETEQPSRCESMKDCIPESKIKISPCVQWGCV